MHLWIQHIKMNKFPSPFFVIGTICWSTRQSTVKISGAHRARLRTFGSTPCTCGAPRFARRSVRRSGGKASVVERIQQQLRQECKRARVSRRCVQCRTNIRRITRVLPSMTFSCTMGLRPSGAAQWSMMPLATMNCCSGICRPVSTSSTPLWVRHGVPHAAHLQLPQDRGGHGLEGGHLPGGHRARRA